MNAEIIWKCLFVTAITLARVGQGMYLSIAGPTLLFLADTFNVDVSEISILFTLRSLGMMVGALAYSFLIYKINFNPLLAFGPGTFLLGLTLAIIPWLNTMAGLLSTGFVSGFMFSFMDGAMQTVYLRIWGEERARPFIQSSHFGISVGGLVAPIIASPFLQMASEDGEVDPGCPASSQNPDLLRTTTVSTFVPNVTSTAPVIDELNPVAWSYVIVGGFSILVSIPLFAFCACGLDDKIKMQGEGIEGGRDEEPIRDVWPILLLLFFFYFFSDMLEATYTNYIYSVALCSAGFTVNGAARLNSLFWIGHLVARLVAILYSYYFKPRIIIIYGIAMIITGMVVMCIFGETISLVMVLVTLLFGIAVAPFYPTGVTWASEVTDISGRYMFVFMFASGLDSMIMLPVAGVLFDISPFNVMYLILAASISIGVIFIGMEIAASRHRKAKEAYKMMNDNTIGKHSDQVTTLHETTSSWTKL